MSTTVDEYFGSLGVDVTDEMKHYGKKGMKWGVRNETPSKLTANKGDTDVTKKVKADYNNLNDQQFQQRYATSKKTYAKRVEKYGDPYAAKNSKNDRDILEARDRQMERAKELERQAFRTYSANGEKALNAAMNKYNRMEKDLLENPDAAMASKMTKGEKIATGVNLGIATAAIIGLTLAKTKL